MPARRVATISVSGPDRKGIVARFATFLFQNNLNIEDIDQHVEVDRFVMTMQFDLAGHKGPLEELEQRLRDLGKQLQMDVRFRLERDHPETSARSPWSWTRRTSGIRATRNTKSSAPAGRTTRSARCSSSGTRSGSTCRCSRCGACPSGRTRRAG